MTKIATPRSTRQSSRNAAKTTSQSSQVEARKSIKGKSSDTAVEQKNNDEQKQQDGAQSETNDETDGEDSIPLRSPSSTSKQSFAKPTSTPNGSAESQIPHSSLAGSSRTVIPVTMESLRARPTPTRTPRRRRSKQAVSETEEEEETDEPDSDDLDATPTTRKRKRTQQKGTSKRGKTQVEKQRTHYGEDDIQYSDFEMPSDLSDLDLPEGQTVTGRILPAPRTGHVPAGQISRNTMKFLVNLQNPSRNDRSWFRLHEPAFRLAEKEFKAFVETILPKFRVMDPQLPMLPSKDLIHRIYRDMRFSNDKTPYKQHFSFGVSRGGRKGIWAGYFVSIQPGNKSVFAGGVWGPDRSELSAIREMIMTDAGALKAIIQDPEFIKWFGPYDPHAEGRTNVFGHSDQLRTTPQCAPKTHPEIALLKLKSVAAVHE